MRMEFLLCKVKAFVENSRLIFNRNGIYNGIPLWIYYIWMESGCTFNGFKNCPLGMFKFPSIPCHSMLLVGRMPNAFHDCTTARQHTRTVCIETMSCLRIHKDV